MALPGGLTKEAFPALGGAQKEEAPEGWEPSGGKDGGFVRQGSKEAKGLKAVDKLNEKELEKLERPIQDTPVVKDTPGDDPVPPRGTPAEEVKAEHFQKTVEQTSQIKDAVERVHAKTQAAKEAAVAVKHSFGDYQGTITALRGQLDSVDDAAHKFEGELLEQFAGDEPARLQPFEEYQPQFGDAAGAEKVAVPEVKIGDVEEPGEPPIGADLKSVADENITAELSFLETAKAIAAADDTTVTVDPPPMALPDGLTQNDFPKLGGAEKEEAKPQAVKTEGKTPPIGGAKKEEATPKATGSGAAASGGNRFEKSVQQSAQIKVAVGKVQEKVKLTKQAAVKVKQGFEDYKVKVVEMKAQLAEVDKQQHEYHEKLLNHFDGEEGDRMSAFDNAPSLESEGLEEGPVSPRTRSAKASATATGPSLLQARERQQLSKEHLRVNAGGSFHAARL